MFYWEQNRPIVFFRRNVIRLFQKHGPIDNTDNVLQLLTHILKGEQFITINAGGNEEYVKLFTNYLLYFHCFLTRLYNSHISHLI